MTNNFKYPPLSATEAAIAIELFNEGLGAGRIAQVMARRIGRYISYSQIVRVLKANGLSRNHKESVNLFKKIPTQGPDKFKGIV